MKRTTFVYVDTEEELIAELGMDREKVLEYFSVDDLVFAIIFEGHRAPRSSDGECIEALVEARYSQYDVIYIPSINKTIGIRYI